MSVRTNVAGQLHDLLADLKADWATRSNEPGHIVLPDFVARHSLSEDRTAPMETMAFLAEMGRMPSRILEQLDVIEARERDWAAPRIRSIEGGLTSFGIVLHGYGDAQQWLTDVNLESLVAASRALNDYDQHVESQVPVDALSAIVGLATQARSTLLDDAEIPDELRRFLLDLLGEIERAARQYAVGGVSNLRSTLDRAAGRWTIASGKSKKTQSWKKALPALAGVAAVVAFAADVTEVTDNSRLPWSDEPVPPVVVNCLPAQLQLESGSRGELLPGPVDQSSD